MNVPGLASDSWDDGMDAFGFEPASEIKYIKPSELGDKIVVSKAKLEDLSDVLAVEEKAWPSPEDEDGCMVASAEKFENRLKASCVLKAVYHGPDAMVGDYLLKHGEMIGVVSFQRTQIDFDFKKLLNGYHDGKDITWQNLVDQGLPENWYVATDNGYITNTHTPNGNTAFLIGVGVIPGIRGARMVNKLINGVLKTAKFDWNVNWVIGYARVPQYSEHSNIELDEYVKRKRVDGKLFDYGLRFHQNNGAKVVCGIPYSMDPEDDLESLGRGALAIYDLSNMEL